MKTIKKKYFLMILVIVSIITILFFLSYFHRFAFRNWAQTNELIIKIRLQGHFDEIENPSYKTKVVFYTQEGPVKELTDQILVKNNQSVFALSSPLKGLDLNRPYAIFIKPDKYLGKLFCKENISGKSCNTPQFIFRSGTNNLDLTQEIFLSGDIQPQDGKVSSYELSKIVNNLSKISNEYMEYDINSNNIVNTVDYSLVLYSLSKNAIDDVIPFSVTITPIPTPTPTPILTSAPNYNPTPTPSPALSPSPVYTPTPTATPPSTPTPTPTTSQSELTGICHITLNGTIYINVGLFGTQCRKLNNEKGYYCVNKQTDCNSNKCIEITKSKIKQMTSSCSNNLASLDEQKTQISCQTEFKSGNCTPEPPPTCVDNRPKCE